MENLGKGEKQARGRTAVFDREWKPIPFGCFSLYDRTGHMNQRMGWNRLGYPEGKPRENRKIGRMNKEEAIRRLKEEDYKVKPGQSFEVGRMLPEDAWGVARCFFAVYGEHYPFDVNYIPEKLIEANRVGDVHSVVARTENGDIIAYGALFRSSAPSPKVYEDGQATVIPEYRSTFAVLCIQDYILNDLVPCEDIDQIFGESVCNHIITQRMLVIEDFIETGMEIGLLPAEAYRNPEFPNDRISTVLSFRRVRDEMRTVYVPPEYAQVLDYILSGLDISRKVVASEKEIPSAMAMSTELETRFFDFAKVARFSAHRVGKDFPEVLATAEKEAQSQGIQVVQVYVNLGEAWSGRATSVLREKSYFFGGFLPRWFDTDGMLMQKLVALPNFDSIKLFSQRSKDILEVIRREISR